MSAQPTPQARIAIVTMANVAAPVLTQLREALPQAVVYGRAGRVDDCDETFERATSLLPRLYREGVTIIGVCSSGILVRCLGPVLDNKHLEPPVLAVSSDGSSVVPLIGGHRGANQLAQQLAELLGGHAAITTAADCSFGIALDEPRPGFVLGNPGDYPNFVARLLAGEALSADSDLPPVVGTGSREVELRQPGGSLSIRVTEQALAGEAGKLVYHPQRLVLGVGCERHCEAAELIELAETSLREAGLAAGAVGLVASIDLKSDEVAVHALAEHLGVPARFFSAAELRDQEARLQTPSEVVRSEVGVAGVSEGAALAAIGADGELRQAKRKSTRATCAIGVAQKPFADQLPGRARGVLHILGTGPGRGDWRLPAVDEALSQCTDLVAYGYYIDLLGPAARGKTVHNFALGEEELRAREALKLAAEGKTVGLVCSGDPGIYAMATLVFELLERAEEAEWRRVDIATTPGITALQSAAARIGAPIGHDFCAISLSNLLTPWEAIEQRLEGAALGDFVVAFYNPVSKRRDWQLESARQILLKGRPPETPVIIGRQLGRAEESVRVTTLGELKISDVDMFTLVMVGSSQSRVIPRGDGRQWVYTPRGYNKKAGVEL